MGVKQKASPAAAMRPSSAEASITARLARCRAELKKRNLSAYLITRRMDAFYLTGFTGEDSAIIVTPRTVHVVSDSRFDEVMDEEVPWAKKHLRKGLLIDEIIKVCHRLRLDRLAVQFDAMNVASYNALRHGAKPTRIVKAPLIANNMRRCKDAGEVESICEAITIAQEAFKATRRSIRIGQTEQVIAARLEYEMRRRGASGPSFETIVAVDANASHPHAHAGARKVKRGSIVLIDWGARAKLYCSDLTRMVAIGRMSRRIDEIYKVVLQAQLAAIEVLRPGARMCDVDGVARGVIAEAGYGEHFGHGLGHGLGLNVHEPPSLSWRSTQRLAAGMVVTVEPGIYLPGVGGVRIEDDVLVTSTGHRVLSDLAKELPGPMV